MTERLTNSPLESKYQDRIRRDLPLHPHAFSSLKHEAPLSIHERAVIAGDILKSFVDELSQRSHSGIRSFFESMIDDEVERKRLEEEKGVSSIFRLQTGVAIEQEVLENIDDLIERGRARELAKERVKISRNSMVVYILNQELPLLNPELGKGPSELVRAGNNRVQ